MYFMKLESVVYAHSVLFGQRLCVYLIEFFMCTDWE